MIKESTMLVDDFEDEVLSLLREFNEIERWTKEKYTLHTKFVSVLEAQNYTSFSGEFKRYLIAKIGSSYLYDVPLYKQGNLYKFRGKRIRIVCSHNGGHGKRYYMAGVICDSPPEKIVEKLQRKKYSYTFPDYVDSHKVIYKSPRFRVIQANHSIRILSKHASKGYVETSGWDSLLVDGKIGEPIATLKHNSDGTIEGEKIRWGRPSVYPSLREAIDELKKSIWA